MHTPNEIIEFLKNVRLPVHNEKSTQEAIERIFTENNVTFEREFRLDAKNIPDFMVGDIAVEVKIKGSRKGIYDQLKRYANFDEVKYIILITNRSLGVPETINGKHLQTIKIGTAWL